MTDHNAINYSGSRIIRFRNPLKLCYKLINLVKWNFIKDRRCHGLNSWGRTFPLPKAENSAQWTVDLQDQTPKASLNLQWCHHQWHYHGPIFCQGIGTKMKKVLIWITLRLPYVAWNLLKLCKTAKIDRSTRTLGRDNRTHA